MRLLGLRSRKRPNCLKISYLRPMHRPHHPRKMAIFTQHSCDLTVRGQRDSVMIGEKGRLKFLFAAKALPGGGCGVILQDLDADEKLLSAIPVGEKGLIVRSSAALDAAEKRSASS